MLFNSPNFAIYFQFTPPLFYKPNNAFNYFSFFRLTTPITIQNWSFKLHVWQLKSPWEPSIASFILLYNICCIYIIHNLYLRDLETLKHFISLNFNDFLQSSYNFKKILRQPLQLVLGKCRWNNSLWKLVHCRMHFFYRWIVKNN